MDRAAPSPLDPPAGPQRVSTGPPRLSQYLEVRPFFPPKRTQGPPRAVLIDGLRERIRTLERHTPLTGGENGQTLQSRWLLGAPDIDVRLGRLGLDPAAVHEVKPAASSAGTHAAALAFALRLAARRLAQISAGKVQQTPRILWCWPEQTRHELGHLYGPGLLRLGLDPRAFLIVEPARKRETLWAIEEGLKSGSLALVIGVLDDVALTPARRLALAAAEHKTPCLMVTSARAPAMGATATRWRIGTAPGAAHHFDARAPGERRCAVALERCRAAQPGPETAYLLEWPDETRCFRVASDVEHRAYAPPRTACRAG